MNSKLYRALSKSCNEYGREVEFTHEGRQYIKRVSKAGLYVSNSGKTRRTIWSVEFFDKETNQRVAGNEDEVAYELGEVGDAQARGNRNRHICEMLGRC